MKDLIEFTIEIDRSENVEQLWKALSDYLLSYDITQIFYRHIPLVAKEIFDREYIYSQNLPNSLNERYINEKFYESDVLRIIISSQIQPYNWLDGNLLGTVKVSQTMFENILMNSMRNEILLLPVYGASSRSGYFCLGVKKLRVEITESALRVCQIACNYAHIKFSQYLTDKEKLVGTLSYRELEIIHWVAKGKSNSVIADIMGISRHTVDSYLRRIFTKMKSTDRTTAALKALSMGLITS